MDNFILKHGGIVFMSLAIILLCISYFIKIPRQKVHSGQVISIYQDTIYILFKDSISPAPFSLHFYNPNKLMDKTKESIFIEQEMSIKRDSAGSILKVRYSPSNDQISINCSAKLITIPDSIRLINIIYPYF